MCPHTRNVWFIIRSSTISWCGPLRDWFMMIHSHRGQACDPSSNSILWQFPWWMTPCGFWRHFRLSCSRCGCVATILGMRELKMLLRKEIVNSMSFWKMAMYKIFCFYVNEFLLYLLERFTNTSQIKISKNWVN